METKNNLIENLSIEQKKACALKLYHSEDFFLIEIDGETKIFEGTDEDKRSEYESTYLQYCMTGEGNEDEPKTFEEWVADELTEVEEYDENDYNLDYICLTDDEADEKWDEELDSYLEECVYPELPDNLKYYFDDDKWKSDARQDGRGHSISSYDGNESEETIAGETFYIYRIN